MRRKIFAVVNHPHQPTSAAPGVTIPAALPEKPALASDMQEMAQLAKSMSNVHQEIWGVTLSDPETHVPTQIVLQKYLNANDGNLVKAKDQFTKTLEWRAKMKPLELLQRKFARSKFDGLGFVTTYEASDSEAKTSLAPEAVEVFTWNIYGGVKNMDETFGDLQKCVK